MPAVMELGQRIQEDYHKFKVSLDNKVTLEPAWTDVGFPSVCCNMFLLPLTNKEATLAYGRAEYSQAGRDIERVGRVKGTPCSCQRRRMPTRTLPVGRSLMVIHRLIEVG